MIVAVLASLLSPAAFAQAPLALDRDRVVQLAREHAPSVRVAEARVVEAQALHAGAGVLAPTNPEIALAAGPRFSSATSVTPDVFVTLAWPVDVSGGRGHRTAVADARTREAEVAADDARRRAVGEALDLWVRALGASERVTLETARAALDAATLATTRARRAAGTVGDGEVALGTILEAEGVARLRVAEGERDALLAALRGRLDLDARTAVMLTGTLEVTDPPPLAMLLERLAHRPDVERAGAALRAARMEVTLQRGLGVPLPRLVFGASHDPEYALRLGVDVPLPVYQRNQTSVGVAEAHVGTSLALQGEAVVLAEAELRAAYATWLAAREASRALEGASAALDDAEHLAIRAYELGQSPLATLLVARREAGVVRAARFDARVALARASVAVALAGGTP